jgi:8-amino-7-oxononanoate synthase
MNNLRRRILCHLANLKVNGLMRQLKSPHGIDFSSNDFLGLANDARIKRAMIEAVERLGVGATASRLLRGERDEFAQVEQQFANWKKTERTLYFSSGYQANIGLLQTFLDETDVVFSDSLNHASIIDGLRLAKAQKVIFNHLDLDSLARNLRKTSTNGQKFLVTESLFSMDGDIAPLDKYAEICAETGTNLIVDEAHAVGVYGETGSGLIEQFGIESQVFLSLNTAGKALGVSGAFVAGKSWAIEYLINKCRSFIFSTAPLPAIAEALKVSIEIIQTEKERRERLLELSKYFRDLLKEHDFAVDENLTQIIPIIIGTSEKAVEVANKLQSEGFDVRAIRPPTVPLNTARLRVSLNISLSENILDDFVRLLVKLL